MNTLPTQEEFSRDLAALCAEHAAIPIILDPLTAWAVMAAIQLASRHPANTGPTQERANKFARQLQKRLSTTPVLAAIAEAGWNRDYDVDVEV